MGSVPSPASRSRRGLLEHPGWSAAVGAVAGVVVAVALGVAGWLPPAPSPAAASRPRAGGPDPATAFVAAWQAHLLGDWSVDEVDQRTADTGATLSFQIHHAQAPPDSLETGGGTVNARVGGLDVACGPGASGSGYVCRSAPAPRSWQQDVAEQMAGLRAVVLGPEAVFVVTNDGPGCWTLALRVPAATVSVVLGRGATYCLDPATGALRSSVVHEDGAVDRVTAVVTHAPARPADLALPPGATA
jgi:hypothetical protein